MRARPTRGSADSRLFLGRTSKMRSYLSFSGGNLSRGPTTRGPHESSADSDLVAAPAAELRVFGEPPTPAELTVYIRTRAWRLRGTIVRVALTAVLAPVAFLVPPHAPWGVGALAGGLILARRRWTERFTVGAFAGHCPRCGWSLTLAKGSRLLVPHALPCEGCHHEVLLHPEIDVEVGRRP